MSAIQAVQGTRYTVANGATQLIPLAVSGSLVASAHIQWLDATTSGTFTLETTNLSPDDAAYDAATSAGNWCTESSVTFTNPSGAAAGGFMLHLGNIGSRRARLRFVAAADSSIVVTPHGKD